MEKFSLTLSLVAIVISTAFSFSFGSGSGGGPKVGRVVGPSVTGGPSTDRKNEQYHSATRSSYSFQFTAKTG